MSKVKRVVPQRKRQTWLALPASGIEEVGHGQEQCAIAEGQASQGEGPADRIGAEKRSLIVSKALDDALQILGEAPRLRGMAGDGVDVHDQSRRRAGGRVGTLRENVAT